MREIFVLVAEWPDASGDAELLRAFQTAESAERARLLVEAAKPMLRIRVDCVELD